jgi:hypothetical protein
VKYINVHNHNALHASTPQTEAHLCCTMSVVSAVVVVGHIDDTFRGEQDSLVVYTSPWLPTTSSSEPRTSSPGH